MIRYHVGINDAQDTDENDRGNAPERRLSCGFGPEQQRREDKHTEPAERACPPAQIRVSESDRENRESGREPRTLGRYVTVHILTKWSVSTKAYGFTPVGAVNEGLYRIVVEKTSSSELREMSVMKIDRDKAMVTIRYGRPARTRLVPLYYHRQLLDTDRGIRRIPTVLKNTPSARMGTQSSRRLGPIRLPIVIRRHLIPIHTRTD